VRFGTLCNRGHAPRQIVGPPQRVKRQSREDILLRQPRINPHAIFAELKALFANFHSTRDKIKARLAVLRALAPSMTIVEMAKCFDVSPNTIRNMMESTDEVPRTSNHMFGKQGLQEVKLREWTELCFGPEWTELCFGPNASQGSQVPRILA
jgi:hypothetical protein